MAEAIVPALLIIILGLIASITLIPSLEKRVRFFKIFLQKENQE